MNWGSGDPKHSRSAFDPKQSFSDDRTLQIAGSARLIGKAYEADPLECPKCKGPMRVIALIEDPAVIRRIFEHLGLWAPRAMQRSPPLGPPAAWPVYASSPLTYHPVPDIV